MVLSNDVEISYDSYLGHVYIWVEDGEIYVRGIRKKIGSEVKSVGKMMLDAIINFSKIKEMNVTIENPIGVMKEIALSCGFENLSWDYYTYEYNASHKIKCYVPEYTFIVW